MLFQRDMSGISQSVSPEQRPSHLLVDICPERQEPPTPTDVMNQAVGGSYLECYLSMAEGFQKPKAIVWLASKGMMGIGG